MAIRVATDLLEQFGDGIWCLELAASERGLWLDVPAIFALGVKPFSR